MNVLSVEVREHPPRIGSPRQEVPGWLHQALTAGVRRAPGSRNRSSLPENSNASVSARPAVKAARMKVATER